jgi:hypothetical protein
VERMSCVKGHPYSSEQVRELERQRDGWLTFALAVRDILDAPSDPTAKMAGLEAILPRQALKR